MGGWRTFEVMMGYARSSKRAQIEAARACFGGASAWGAAAAAAGQKQGVEEQPKSRSAKRAERFSAGRDGGRAKPVRQSAASESTRGAPV